MSKKLLLPCVIIAVFSVWMFAVNAQQSASPNRDQWPNRDQGPAAGESNATGRTLAAAALQR